MTTVQVVPRATELPVAQLTFDSDVQCRESIQMGVVAEYKESLAAGVTFPPLVVFFDGKTNWVADGFHRGHAYRDTGTVTCPCDVRQGSKRDAILYAVGANTGHGLRRSNADKRRAVETLLRDPEWCQKSDRWIAEKCCVSHPFVSNLRPATGGNGYHLPESTTVIETRKGSDGKNYPVKPRAEKSIEKSAEEPPVERTEEKPVEKAEAVEAPRSSHVGLVAISDDGDGVEEDETEDDDQDGRDFMQKGIVFRDMKRALLDCWARCPAQFRQNLREMIQYEAGELK